jgi:porin
MCHFSWKKGQPNEDTFGESLRDQYSTELFCRFQVAENFQLTPDVQLVINPARNPTADQSWIFGIRGRLIF